MSEEPSMQSKGGQARKNALTPEQRSEIARNAAMAKWDKSETAQNLPKATFGSADRPLRIGNLEIPCYVLDDGKRVITQAGVLAALSMSPGTATKGGGDRIANFVNTKSINSFASSALREMIINPIKFRAQSSMAYGYEAVILPEICDAVLEARNAGKLNYQQEHIAKQAEILVRAFAKVGIIALVDEATGYQEIRDRQALAEILKKYIDGALYEWAKTFPIALYKEIFRLKGWAWNNGKMPQVVGHYTNDLVYDRLTKGMLDELRRLNPKGETGRRKHRNYQFLTPEIGYPALNQRIYELLGMARASSSWEQFYRLVDRTFPKLGDTISLPFTEDV
jgi:P63C domain